MGGSRPHRHFGMCINTAARRAGAGSQRSTLARGCVAAHPYRTAVLLHDRCRPVSVARRVGRYPGGELSAIRCASVRACSNPSTSTESACWWPFSVHDASTMLRPCPSAIAVSVTTPWNGPPVAIVMKGPGALVCHGSGSSTGRRRYRGASGPATRRRRRRSPCPLPGGPRRQKRNPGAFGTWGTRVFRRGLFVPGDVADRHVDDDSVHPDRLLLVVPFRPIAVAVWTANLVGSRSTPTLDSTLVREPARGAP